MASRVEKHQSCETLARIAPINWWLFLYVRLEIEAQEQALEQLEKSTQEATRKAHDAEQKAKSALDALKVCLSDKLYLSLPAVLTIRTCSIQTTATCSSLAPGGLSCSKHCL